MNTIKILDFTITIFFLIPIALELFIKDDLWKIIAGVDYVFILLPLLFVYAFILLRKREK